MADSVFLPLNSFATAICDAIITTSILFYLRPWCTGLVRRENYIQRISYVFVQMGVITFINALLVAILYFQSSHAGSYLTLAPGAVLSKSYTNSMLAVLNARNHFRQDQLQKFNNTTIEVPTVPTIR